MHLEPFCVLANVATNQHPNNESVCKSRVWMQETFHQMISTFGNSSDFMLPMLMVAAVQKALDLLLHICINIENTGSQHLGS
jgi:hypothetical protein